MLNRTNGNGTANGVRKDVPIIIDGHELLWDGLPPAVTEALGQSLDPSLISQRRGRAGRTFAYLEGHAAIAQANEVFGYGGWGYELLDGPTLHEIEHADPRTGEVRSIRAYAATVRITVPGAPSRTDVGFHAVTDETADGHETAYKGAVTDGMKRALRSFGDQFGNGLYGDASSVQRQDTGDRRPAGQASKNSKPDTDPAERIEEARLGAMRAALVELCVKQGFDEKQVRDAVRKQTGAELDDLPAEELEGLVESATNKLRQKQEALAA